GLPQLPSFPVQNAVQSAPGGGYDAIIAKIDPTLTQWQYATYWGGAGDDWGDGIAADATGPGFVTGRTAPPNFTPTTAGFHRALGGTNAAFTTQLNSSGSGPVYSSYVGGLAMISVTAWRWMSRAGFI